jgi:prolipoprotein diacylglyceryltransferase
MGFLENPMIDFSLENLLLLLNTKSIMGGLFGGLIGVEVSKKIINEKQSSGDLFTFPIILGIIIGRIGCFLSGTNEFTYGNETDFFTGMDLGDGLMRHPTSLYEIIFLILLFLILQKIKVSTAKENGLLFKIFMISYFGFRFLIEFIKPNIFYVLGLSSIQLLCISCWIYYSPLLKKMFKNAH